MNRKALLFFYGWAVGIATVEAIVGEWRAVLTALLAVMMVRLATQGGEK